MDLSNNIHIDIYKLKNCESQNDKDKVQFTELAKMLGYERK